MTYLLRSVKKSRWLPPLPDDVPANSFWDLRTDAGTLSVYEVNLGDDALINRCVAALVVQTTHLEVLHLAFVDRALVESLGVGIKPSLGVVPDELVSAVHRDITNLTGRRLVELAVGFAGDLRQYNLAGVAAAINTSLDQRWIKRFLVPESMLEKLARRRGAQ